MYKKNSLKYYITNQLHNDVQTRITNDIHVDKGIRKYNITLEDEPTINLHQYGTEDNTSYRRFSSK